MNLPFFSIVTPVKNGEKFIEQTIKSIVNQSFKNFEYIVVDGNSTGRTKIILNKYKNKINHIISKRDKGMYHAIRTGFEFSKGKYFLWVNSDDFLANRNVLRDVFNYLRRTNDQWITGRTSFLTERSNKIRSYIPLYYPRFIINKGWAHNCMWGFIQQESTIFSKKIYKQVRGVDVSNKVASDYYLWKKFSKVCPLKSINIDIGVQRKWKGQMQKDLNLYYKEMKKKKCKFNIFYSFRIIISALNYLKLIILKTN